MLRFTAEAGATYDLVPKASELHRPMALSLVDADTDAVVASNEPASAAACLAADVQLASGWMPAEFWTGHAHAGVVFVTQREEDGRVAIGCRFGHGGPPDADLVMDELWDDFKDTHDEPDMAVLERGSGAAPMLAFTCNGLGEDDLPAFAYTVLRQSGDRVHVLTWWADGRYPSKEELAPWRERFLAAGLRAPEAR